MNDLRRMLSLGLAPLLLSGWASSAGMAMQWWPGARRRRRRQREEPSDIRNRPEGVSIPGEFEQLYGILDSKLTSFERQLDQRWDGTKHPVDFCAGLVTANPNSGEALIAPATFEMTKKYLDRLKNLGVKGIAIDINFPLLMPDFYRSKDEYQRYLDFYRKLSGEVKRRDLVAAIEFTAVFPDFSPMPVADYYKKLSFEEYKRRRLEMIRTIITELKPEYLTVGNEPDTEAHNTGQPVNDIDNYVGAIKYYLSELKRDGIKGTKIGAGFGTWLKEYTQWARRYADDTELDFLNVHIYPVASDLLDRTLTIADIARKSGKGMVMHEAWLYKWKQGEARGVGNARETYSRDAYRFWYPLDQKFLTIIVKMSHFKKFDYISPFWSNFFFDYLDYDKARNLSAGERLKNGIINGVKGALAGRISPTGETYQKLISS